VTIADNYDNLGYEPAAVTREARYSRYLDGERVAGQMRDLEPYQPVSAMPAVRRDLPEAALARLGARPGQRNLLVRVVLRHLDRTLTDAEANALRDRLYAAIHQGSRTSGRPVRIPCRPWSPRPGRGSSRRSSPTTARSG
jgi:hypothetical protein